MSSERSGDWRRVVLMTAIVKCKTIQNNGTHFRKYRKIKNTQRDIDKFIRFLLTIPGGVDHVNFYDRETKKFMFQERNDQ